MILTIEINRSNANPARPTAPINTLQDLSAAFAGCWQPPPADSSRQPVDLTFQVSFKRSGELFGKPRAISFARTVTDEERQRYYTGGRRSGRSLRENAVHGIDGRRGRGPHLPGQFPGQTQQQKGLKAMADREKLTLETTKGNVVIELRPDLAPKHVERIKTLANEGFYDGIVFHRVIEGFMAQTGCPQGTGTGGSDYPNLPAEFNAEPHVRGTASMARAQNPNSANSQFFICFDDAGFLDKQYTVWGKVIEGMDNVDKIKRGEPVQNPDKIVKARVA